MTDRELLEAAAKAAGIRYKAEASKPHPTSGVFWGLWLTFDRPPSEYDRRYWNPLTDDGDALRLAVKLCIDIEHNHPLAERPYVRASRLEIKGGREGADEIEEIEDESQRLACVRRAIVRAAAAVAIKEQAN